jgi:hypothetical protein
MDCPTKIFTAKAITTFLVVSALLGSGAYFWAASIDPLAGIGWFILRGILYCFVFALVPWSIGCAFKIYGSHTRWRHEYESIDLDKTMSRKCKVSM